MTCFLPIRMQKLLLVHHYLKIAPQAESGKYFQIWFFPQFGAKNGSVLRMRMQVILDSLFARASSAITAGETKGEFRDWTIRSCSCSCTRSTGGFQNLTFLQKQHDNSHFFFFFRQIKTILMLLWPLLIVNRRILLFISVRNYIFFSD